MRGGKNQYFLPVDSVEKLLAGRPKNRVRSKMIDEGVSVREQRHAVWDIGKDHGDSRMPKSGSSAIRRSVSESPVQPIIPYVRWAQPPSACMVTSTFS